MQALTAVNFPLNTAFATSHVFQEAVFSFRLSRGGGQGLSTRCGSHHRGHFASWGRGGWGSPVPQGSLVCHQKRLFSSRAQSRPPITSLSGQQSEVAGAGVSGVGKHRASRGRGPIGQECRPPSRCPARRNRSHTTKGGGTGACLPHRPQHPRNRALHLTHTVVGT